MAIEDATVLANALLNNPPADADTDSEPKPSFAAALREFSELRIPRYELRLRGEGEPVGCGRGGGHGGE